MTCQTTIAVLEQKVRNLPLIDSAVAEVITLLNNPESNFEHIVEKLSPGLATRFLYIANKASAGREVRSIHYAVKLLGYGKMKDILITSILMDHFAERLENFSFEKFIKQAQFCATVSRLLGEMLDFNRPEDLFTVATLQNIGKLVIAIYFKPELKEIIALKKTEGLSSCVAEKRVLGVSHGEIGAIVLRRFCIPPDICEAVGFHDHPEDDLPAAADFNLQHIARATTRIVARFSLPEKMEPKMLMERLQAITAEGKEKIRSRLRAEMRWKGYQEIFPALLEQATDTIYRGLKQHLPERSPSFRISDDPCAVS
ncbi:MAG: HDOD domain-containing protein [Desulfobacterales bacterium]|nr:MAG: HDOD domain-containing protein [Desulfobacterales bacterium]